LRTAIETRHYTIDKNMNDNISGFINIIEQKIEEKIKKGGKYFITISIDKSLTRIDIDTIMAFLNEYGYQVSPVYNDMGLGYTDIQISFLEGRDYYAKY
jgi:ribosome-interacting GTPase 1